MANTNKIYILQVSICNKSTTFKDSSSTVKTFISLDDAIVFGKQYLKTELEDILYYNECNHEDAVDSNDNYITDIIDKICDYTFKIIVSTSDKKYNLYNKPGDPDSGINTFYYYNDIKDIVSKIDFAKTGIALDADIINALLLTQDMVLNLDINGNSVKYDTMGDGVYISYDPYMYNRTSAFKVGDMVEYNNKLGIIYDISDIYEIVNKIYLKRYYCINCIGEDECGNIKYYSYDNKYNITDADIKHPDTSTSFYIKWNRMIKALPTIVDYFNRDISKINFVLSYFNITNNIRYKDFFTA